jgi:hypothetical protein
MARRLLYLTTPLSNARTSTGPPTGPGFDGGLIGHTDPTPTMRVQQQVIDMGEGGLETLEPKPPARECLPARRVEGAGRCRTFVEAAEGIRTLDLLHGKWLCEARYRHESPANGTETR